MDLFNSTFFSAFMFVMVLLPACSSQDNTPTFSSGGRSLDATQSGVWSGYWVQDGNRGVMSLDIRIENNLISGQGSDEVGPFVLNGEYDSQGNVKIVKNYTGAHTVIYGGLYQNDTIKGEWRIYDTVDASLYDSGAFEISWNSETL